MRAIQRGVNWAVEMGHIDKSPIAKVKKPTPVRREAYLWPKQYQQVLSLIRDEAFRDYVEILRHTGCRPKEARIVEARHCLWEDRCWVLPTNLAKGKMEPRTVLLSNRALEICRRRAELFPEGPMFRNLLGTPWTSNAITDRFRRLNAKLDFHVTAYAIRHTFATDAILRGVDLVTIAKLMGHKNLKMLTEVYEHVSKRQDYLRKGLDQATGHLNPQGAVGEFCGPAGNLETAPAPPDTA